MADIAAVNRFVPHRLRICVKCVQSLFHESDTVILIFGYAQIFRLKFFSLKLKTGGVYGPNSGDIGNGMVAGLS